MKKNTLLLSLGLIVLVSCSTFTSRSVHGEGPLTKQQRTVGNFDQIQSFGSFDVSISSAETNSVKVEAEENLQEFIEVVVDNNTLNIRQKRNYNIDSPHGIKITLFAPALRALRLFGSGNVQTENRIPSPGQLEIESSGSGDIIYDLKAESLKAQLSGSGKMQLAGMANDVDAAINGSGNIKAKDLETNKTGIRISGSGNAEINVKEKLNLEINGSGDVRYWGSPDVNTHIAGSGTVVKDN
ncbi:MAG: head GIN domain-containing protein [Flavitalea sp.]